VGRCVSLHPLNGALHKTTSLPRKKEKKIMQAVKTIPHIN